MGVQDYSTVRYGAFEEVTYNQYMVVRRNTPKNLFCVRKRNVKYYSTVRYGAFEEVTYNQYMVVRRNTP